MCRAGNRLQTVSRQETGRRRVPGLNARLWQLGCLTGLIECLTNLQKLRSHSWIHVTHDMESLHVAGYSGEHLDQELLWQRFRLTNRYVQLFEIGLTKTQKTRVDPFNPPRCFLEFQAQV